MKNRIIAICYLLSAISEMACAQGTAFSYQGRLNDGSGPAGGIYDLRFAIYDLVTNGTLIVGPVTNSATSVSNGLFTVMLDFGVTPFTGADRWLDIAVRTNGGGAFTALNLRQKLTPAPYAIAAGNLAAVIANNYTFGTNATVSGGNQNNAGNNVTTVAGGEFNNAYGIGATVGGGHVNTAGDNFATVSGGANNNAGGLDSTVGGGHGNSAAGIYSTVGGGDHNQATNFYATVPGGQNNVAGGQYSFAAGRQAQALHQGAFVWSDSQPTPFASTTNDQFLVRAQGGVRLVTSGAGMTLDGLFGLSGQLRLDTPNGFSQSSQGNFFIDAPFIPGGRFAVLTNGNVGIGINSPATPLHVNGDTTIAGNVDFGTQPRQMLNLWQTQYGIGVQSYTTYFRTDNAGANNGFSWFSGGVHSDNQNDPGGGAELMRLTLGSGLTVNGALTLPATMPTIYTGGNLLLRSDGSLLNFFAGQGAGNSGMSGSQNTGVGNSALKNNTSGADNTADGSFALFRNTGGNFNTAVGDDALYSNTNGSDNTAEGTLALYSNTSGNFNTAIGYAALYNSTNGSQNIAVGYQAGYNVTTGTGNIDIGNSGVLGDSGTIRIGGSQTLTYIAGIYNSPAIGGGTAVYIDSNGRVGVTPSSQHFKQNIRAMGDASDVLLALQPVTFQYKSNIDPQGHPQFGLIAEQVEQVDPNLVLHDPAHGIYTVRYEAVNAMLLNEFLKEHRKVEEQSGEIQDLKQQNAALGKRLEKLEHMVKSQIERN
ncbi:MAG TPA: tail fiber domain-containing protein [Candidatus Acidoferrum sp.]|nr:tail fiber domain-containing protein [Candidatus Acidoferrum sp.]